VWIALDNGRADGVEQVLATLAAIGQFAAEIESRLAGDGVQGIPGTVALYRRLRATLDDIPSARLEAMRAEIEALERWLGEAARCLAALARLKQLVG
jgi:hypothetical protein